MRPSILASADAFIRKGVASSQKDLPTPSCRDQAGTSWDTYGNIPTPPGSWSQNRETENPRIKETTAVKFTDGKSSENYGFPQNERKES